MKVNTLIEKTMNVNYAKNQASILVENVVKICAFYFAQYQTQHLIMKCIVYIRTQLGAPLFQHLNVLLVPYIAKLEMN